jgi:hypothetical protein
MISFLANVREKLTATLCSRLFNVAKTLSRKSLGLNACHFLEWLWVVLEIIRLRFP